ncbi:MAG: YggS family pyridoxal phosphate-dependent enzyme [Parasporobacterium sp.]|nr:YggS family pyridoxal phosphate-dependent enzyme [Parasporobacterium sp.]
MIKDNYRTILNNVETASAQSPFEKKAKLIAVSKMHSAGEIMEVYEEGQRDFGENKVQELTDKAGQLPDDIRWHMIGHLQTNKVKNIIDRVYMIHSVDSEKLAVVISREAQKHALVMPVLIEVNIGNEPSKSGVKSEELEDIVRKISVLPNIKVQGLMCIPPASADAEKTRKYFAALRNLSIDINQLNIDNIQMNVLSMGMSDDYAEAISEGSDYVRVGTGIFGMRDYGK